MLHWHVWSVLTGSDGKEPVWQRPGQVLTGLTFWTVFSAFPQVFVERGQYSYRLSAFLLPTWLSFFFFFNNKKNFRAATAPLITSSRGSNGWCTMLGAHAAQKQWAKWILLTLHVWPAAGDWDVQICILHPLHSGLKRGSAQHLTTGPHAPGDG